MSMPEKGPMIVGRVAGQGTSAPLAPLPFNGRADRTLADGSHIFLRYNRDASQDELILVSPAGTYECVLRRGPAATHLAIPILEAMQARDKVMGLHHSTWEDWSVNKKITPVPGRARESSPPPPTSPKPEAAGGTKHDRGKPRMSLIPYEATKAIAEVLTFGAEKYDPWNWAKGLDYSRILDAAERHLGEFKSGTDLDPESGLHHIAHAACNLVFLLYMIKHQPERDDRHRRPAAVVEESP